MILKIVFTFFMQNVFFPSILTCDLDMVFVKFTHKDKYHSVSIYKYLDLPWDPRAVHSAGDVHRVPPDVILWPSSPDHPCYYWTHINTCAFRDKNIRKHPQQFLHLTENEKTLKNLDF